MRVIAGTARGVPLQYPGNDARPTSDRVRESVFGILSPIVRGARVLDLFAGSGALGIEALSRGASGADFVEQNAKACRLIGGNLAKTRLQGNVCQREVFAWLKEGGKSGGYDLILADPPYAKQPDDRDFAAELLAAESLAAISAPDAFLVLETGRRTAKNEASFWEQRDSRAYGSTVVTFYQRAGG